MNSGRFAAKDFVFLLRRDILKGDISANLSFEVIFLPKPSVKSVLLASLIALLVVMIQPSFFMASMLVCIAPIAISLLYAWAGWIPAGIASAGTAASLTWFASISGVVNPALAFVGAVLVLVMPGIVSIVMMEKRIGFFKRMIAAAAAQTAALLGCVAFVYLGMGIDLVDALTEMMRSTVEYMPQEMIEQFLNMYYYSGMLTQESVEELTGGVLLWADVMKVFDQVFELTNYQLKQIMPAMLINSGLVSGILMTAVPSLITRKRGFEPPVPHVPVHEWFLPARAVGGLTVCMVTGFVLNLMKVDGAAGVVIVFSQVVSTLCIVQGIAALTRRFRDAGSGKGVRIGLTVAALLFASQFLEMVGMASALFGRRGAVSTWMRNKMKEMEENRKDDDDE